MKKFFTVLILSFVCLFAVNIAFAQSQPPVLDPANPTTVIEYWQFLYALLMPVLNYVIAWIWPSNTKKELTIKTFSFALAVIIALVFYKGFTAAVIFQAVLSFLGQFLLYDKLLNPLGLNSPAQYKTQNKKAA